MSVATKSPITVQSARDYRTAVCRFHNTLYLGCVIGTLLGFGLADAALSWPKRAWARARAQPGPFGRGREFVHATH
jgi:hypothetical protein